MQAHCTVIPPGNRDSGSHEANLVLTEKYVFPSRNDPKMPMNSQTANAALKRIGYSGKLVAHGLRSIASTAMNEAGLNADVIEAALAHTYKNEVRKAYNRSIYLDARIELMNWWGQAVHQQYK